MATKFLHENGTYCNRRLSSLGITDEDNSIKLLKYSAEERKNVLVDEKIFRPHEKGLEIIVYGLDRIQPTYTGDSSRWKKQWSIIRLEKPIVKANGDTIKYLMPKGQGSYPFFPPELIGKFEKKQKIPALYLTEGYIKARKGAMHGLDIIGVPSITHLRNKENNSGLHSDIVKIIDLCSVERVVWLTDGDALDVSSKAVDQKEEVDLYKRPASFYASISTFKQLLDDKDVEKYWAHIDTDGILEQFNLLKDLDKPEILGHEVKGLDDIMVKFPDKVDEIVKDLNTVGSNGFWFQKFKITTSLAKVREYFRLNDVNQFILFHQERNPSLKNREFIFNGTKYKYNDEKGACEVLIPGDAKLYFRVGDDYYKWVEVPNQYKQKERQFHPRSKTTIADDHGKHFLKYVPKYEAFCNVPDHVNYQPVHNNCFNVYAEIEHKPEEDTATPQDFPSINSFLHHIFGETTCSYIGRENKEKKTYQMIELAMDYLQLLYQHPQRKLPILCLVSRENNTGKSTFANFLRIMLGANVAIVGNADLAGDFNAHWASKSVVVCDETKIDKQHVVEKIKALSTARKIFMNAKGKGQVELDCFIKFVLITNNEESFIYASDEDIRYWVIKVPVLKEDNPHIVDLFVDEMPAFLAYLGKRKMSTEDKSRMWFHPSILRTDALRKVIQHSVPAVQKELATHLREMFLDLARDEDGNVWRDENGNIMDKICMSLNDIKTEFFPNKLERHYLTKIIQEGLKIYPEKSCRYHYYKCGSTIKEIGEPAEQTRIKVKRNGRPYVFKWDQFLTREEISAIEDDIKIEANPQNKELPFQ